MIEIADSMEGCPAEALHNNRCVNNLRVQEKKKKIYAVSYARVRRPRVVNYKMEINLAVQRVDAGTKERDDQRRKDSALRGYCWS